MWEYINRFRARPEFEDKLDHLYGCSTWRDGREIKDRTERKNFFFDLYKNQLKSAGAKEVVQFELYQKSRLKYAIFFGTQELKGSDKMKQAIWQAAPTPSTSGLAYRGTRSQGSHQLTLGLDSPDFSPLKQALQEEFRGRGYVTINEIQDFVASDRTDYHTGRLKRSVLKPMEKASEIEVDDRSRKKRGTYPDGTRICFP